MIKIIDYGMGNCGSIKNMLRHLGTDCEVITEPQQLYGAQAIILPGVGSFDNGVERLQPFKAVLEQLVVKERIPFLGICLGMQLLLNSSEEGSLPGLGWIKGTVKRFDFSKVQSGNRLVVPHMGWNEVWSSEHSKLIDSPEANKDRFYFVHSFHACGVDESHIMAWCHYGFDFVCAVKSNNIMGVQFHPEKSHKFGKRVFSQFIELSRC